MHVSRVYPFVIALGKAFPFDQVLELLRSAIAPMIYNSLDLLFFFTID